MQATRHCQVTSSREELLQFLYFLSSASELAEYLLPLAEHHRISDGPVNL